MVVPLFVGRPKSMQALEEAMAGDKQLLLAAQRRAKTDDPNAEDIFSIGTVGHIIQLLRFPKGPVKVLVEGRARANIRGFHQIDPFFVCDVDDVEEPEEDQALVRALMASTQDVFEGLRQAQHADPAGDAGLGPHDRRARTVERHDRRARRAQVERQARAARDAITCEAARAAVRADARRDRDSSGREEAAHSRQEADGKAAERVLPERTDAGHPEGTG